MASTRVYRSAPRDDETTLVLSYLDATEVAERIGYSRATVKRWAREGKPGFPTPSPAGYFREWQIDRYIADSRISVRPVGAL